MICPHRIFLVLIIATATQVVLSFTVQTYNKIYPSQQLRWQDEKFTTSKLKTCMRMSSPGDNSLHKVPEDDDTPIPFVEVDNSSFIECYADSIAIVNGVEYTIGSPCDHAVALCYFDEDKQLIPIELEEDRMEEIFALAARCERYH